MKHVGVISIILCTTFCAFVVTLINTYSSKYLVMNTKIKQITQSRTLQ